MEQKVCLDTDFVIAILKNESRADKFIDKIQDFQVFVSSITLFELLLRETNLDKIEVFIDKVEVLDFNGLAARKASLIFKSLRKKGKMIDIRDIFIGSVCLVNNCRLATFNKRHFEDIKELVLHGT